MYHHPANRRRRGTASRLVDITGNRARKFTVHAHTSPLHCSLSMARFRSTIQKPCMLAFDSTDANKVRLWLLGDDWGGINALRPSRNAVNGKNFRSDRANRRSKPSQAKIFSQMARKSNTQNTAPLMCLSGQPALKVRLAPPQAASGTGMNGRGS